MDCGGHVQTGWYLFVRLSVLPFSTIFLLDCGGNVQTGWYLFVKVSILTFSTIFQMDCGGIFQTGGICLLGYQFCPFYDFSIGFLGKCSNRVVFVS
jgi:hypothetical protein